MRERVLVNKTSCVADESRQAFKNKARELLMRGDFSEYKRQMEKQLDGLLKTLLEYKNTDPVAYAFFIQAKIKEYTTLAILLNKVNLDAGVNNEKD